MQGSENQDTVIPSLCQCHLTGAPKLGIKTIIGVETLVQLCWEFRVVRKNRNWRRQRACHPSVPLKFQTCSGKIQAHLVHGHLKLLCRYPALAFDDRLKNEMGKRARHREIKVLIRAD